MTTQTLVPTKSAATITLTALNNVTYAASSVIDLSAIKPLLLAIEVLVTPGTVSGNKQAKVFVKFSFDNSVFTSGPESGTTTTDEPNLFQIGTLPLNTNAAQQVGTYSVDDRIAFVPAYLKVIVFNDSGVAFAGSGCSVNYIYWLGNSLP